MEEIKDLAVIFCAVCVLSGGFRILVGGALEKNAGFLLSLLLLTGIVCAFADTTFNFDFDIAQTVAQSGEWEEEMSEYQAEYICGKLLKEKGIEFEKIYVDTTKCEDGSIVINEIRIKGTKIDEAAKVIKQSGICETVKEK